MSGYDDKHRVTLEVNGQQAEDTLKKLRQQAQDWQTALARAAAEGDNIAMKKAEKELRKVNREIKAMQSNSQNAAKVLQALDKATPRELRNTLKQLKQELEGIERGSEAWDAQTAKIKRVQKELNSVNASLRVQESGWERFNRKLNDWQTAITAGALTAAGVVAAGKQAVDAYASMEQEMANVRKFTGMTAAQVATLNEEFKKMDTRTSREELNKLAQEAGMLGKTSQEDVIGYVRAADIINVALNDIGEEATLTLSKLTGIFGIEDQLGTEKSLLAVGSVINELSQNCEASSSYLAEFASRMGGVGAQAGMTIQQIMAFAAVLDSNNQNVEASSTALAQVLTRMYQEPAKYARVAGLDVEKFTNLLKNDANEALLTFLDALKGSGGMADLAPMFEEMGENGARAVAALSVLAGKIDEVRAQQQVANQAFAEGTSVQKEFNVQNSTVQAGLDKAKNRFNEIAVELGQKLLPVMRYAISSSSAIIKVLNSLFDILAKNIGTVTALAAAIAAYTVVVKASTIASKAYAVATRAAAAATSLFNKVTKASPWGLVAAAAAATVTVIWQLVDSLNNAGGAQKRLNDAMKQMRDISVSEERKLAQLRGKLLAAEKGTEDYNAAKKEIIDNYGQYYDGLEQEIEAVGFTADMYDRLTAAIRKSTAARQYDEFAKGEQEAMDNQLSTALETIEERLTDRFGDRVGYEYYEAIRNALIKGTLYLNRDHKLIGLSALGDNVRGALRLDDADWGESALDAINAYAEAQYQSMRNLEKFRRKWGDFDKPATTTPATTATTPISTEGIPDKDKGDGNILPNAPANMFAEEQAWRDQAEAYERIMYARGLTDYEEYTTAMNDIAVEFYKKQLSNTEMSAEQRLEVETNYFEAVAKARKEADNADAKKATDDENNRYAGELAELKQAYIDGKITREQYQALEQQSELEHLRIMTRITVEGTDERLNAERNYQDALIADQEARQKQAEDAAREHEQELARIRNRFFSMSPEEAAAQQQALSLLDEVYKQELAKAGDNEKRKTQLTREYNDARAKLSEESEAESGEALYGAFAQAIEASTEWLGSDGAQAFTQTMQTVVSSMASIFQGLTQIIQAEASKQSAAVEKRYDREIAAAQGNSYRVSKLEEDKEAEVARIKNEANRKAMSMQVIQAVAQTAIGAINAYSSAAAIPLVGYILAPIAAAAAVAAGMIQVAAIKKQQQASEAQGYAEGGFTPQGGKYQPVGTVHAGEWVASQKLVNSPVTRPVIDMLDWAQRNNTVGTLQASDVSRSITAPQAVAAGFADGTLNAVLVTVAHAVRSQGEATEMLNQRLSEPFVTVNTITGDNGIKKAQDDYNRLMRNKSPKSRQYKYQ